jgi:hypothetical protein
LLPAAGFGHGAELDGGVAHDDGLGGPFHHVDVVPVVADGHGLAAVDAEAGGETGKGRGLGDADGEEVEDGEVARGIDGAGASAGVGERAGLEGGFGCAHLARCAR